MLARVFDPPSPEQMMTLYYRAEGAFADAQAAQARNDLDEFRKARARHDYLVSVYNAMQERQFGAKVN